jgi:DinB superfamily
VQKRLAEILTYLDSTRARLLDVVKNVQPSFAEMRPRGGTWSVAEIVMHLAMVEAGVAKLIARSVTWGREKGIGPETSDESVMSSLDELRLIEATKKFSAPERLLPPPDSRMSDALHLLLDSRRELRDALVDADGLDLSAIKRPHIILGDLSMYQWGVFIGQHEERHTRQIERTLRDLGESAAEAAPLF